MINTIISSALGSITNRIRGGGFHYLFRRYGIDSLFGGKNFHDAVFALWFGVLFGTTYDGFIDGTPSYTVDLNWLVVAILFGTMWLGRAPGWGAYIGGIIDKKVKQEKEIEQIDEFILHKTDKPVLRNVIALSLRGAMWTGALALGMLAIKALTSVAVPAGGALLLFVFGLLMGPTYWLAIELSEKVTKKGRAQGWPLGEYIWGGLLWGAISLLILNLNVTS